MSSWSIRATRLATALLATLAVLLSMALPVSAAGRSAESKLGVQQPAGAESGNPAPSVVPSLREWSGGRGFLTVGPGSRIVVDSANKTVLADDARMLSDDLGDVTGRSMPVVSTPRPRAGDIFLSLQGADPALGPEGYGLNVGDVAEVRGTTEAGVFYGTQTLLQILKTVPGHRALPRGSARDWPQQRERGFLLDAGRKYYSPDFVVQAIREMSYLKLNTLQIHFSDNDAFRLVSERFPYLAAPQAYTRADIRRFETAARRYHVTIIPEIEMPGHSAAVLLARPDLGFDCPQMGNATVDVTKPAVRQFETALIDEFAPLFSGPEFMIATDEYPTQATQQTCPELVQYAQAHGFASTADVFVDFINEMNRVVRSHGKRTVIWNWWNVDQNPTTAPDKNITVEVWTTAATGTTVDHSPQTYLDMGYNVVASPSDTLYVTPGSLLLPDPQFLYEQWAPLMDPHLDGYQISVWADNAQTAPDSYFDAYLRRPREVLADRLWGGPRLGTVADFFARADAIGTPAGVPDYLLPNQLTGTPYGTSPGYLASSTFEKAFDGDPGTYFLYAQPNGGYTGIDLGAGHESAVSLVHFFPTPGAQNLDRLVGGRFEGCADGPTSGCQTLATVATRPAFGWNELAVTNGAGYRWLRYVGPDGGYGSVAEIEFIAPSRALTVHAPEQLRQLGDNQVVTSYLNTTTNSAYNVRLGLTAYATDDRAARTVRPLNSARFPVVQPGETVSTTWQVDIPLSATSGTYHLVGRAAYQRSPGASQPIFETGGFTRATLGPAFDAALDPDFIGLDTGDSRDTKLQITNHAAAPVTIAWHHVRLPSTNPAFTLNPADGTLPVPAGGTASVTLTAVAAANATGSTPGPARVDLTATSAGQPNTRAGSVTLTVLWYPGAQPSLAATYNNAGITDDADVTAATFDGGVASYSAQGLAAVGLTPGATVNHDGQTFTWPNVPPAQLDNTATDGQVIATSGSGAKIGFLGAGCCGIQTGTLYITYTDGSIARAPLTFADWWTDQPVPGSDIVATSPWNVPPGNPDPDHPVSVYYAAIPLDPGKTVRFITLPTNLNLHVFAMAIG
jgi:Glycosyl hydrolase family 20, catalytic domain/Glycosyl hydrolase family 20, domain 2/NPCBM-associated, NEW3 domain of alpha-galactosidase